MDATERARLRALCEAAMLPLCEAADRCGEWYVVQVVPPLTVAEMWNSSAGGNVSRARAQLFAAACTALPALLDALETALRERDEARAEVERLRAAITRLRDNAAEMQSCARAVGHVEEREACAELADAIRDAAWTAGAEAMREAILDELPCVTAERDECAARMHRVAIPAPPCPEVSR